MAYRSNPALMRTVTERLLLSDIVRAAVSIHATTAE
jgi:hypothetical protein